MITVIFPVGMFGSTIEYCLRRFSNEIGIDAVEICDNGSMHSLTKINHLTEFTQPISTIPNIPNQFNILTPVYPLQDSRILTAQQSVDKWTDILSNYSSKVIFIRPISDSEVERNDLFSFYKTKEFKRSFIESVLASKEKNWNSEYNSWKDMKPWEVREAFSFYCTDNKNTFSNIADADKPNWLCIGADDIIYDFISTMKKIFDFVGLTFNLLDIEEFYKEWFQKQQYILEEYNLVKKIFNSIKKDNYLEWDSSALSIYSEAILQANLRSIGIDLACANLNNFPTDTTNLKKFFIEK